MLAKPTSNEWVRALVVLSLFFLIAQPIFMTIDFFASGEYAVTSLFVNRRSFTFAVVYLPLIQFAVSWLLLAAVYIYSLIYIIKAIVQLFSLSERTASVLAMSIWLYSVIAILWLNMYFVPHSTFTKLMRKNLLQNYLTDSSIKIVALTALAIGGGLLTLAFLNAVISIYKNRDRLRHSAIFAGFFAIIGMNFYYNHAPQQNIIRVATPEKPNIIMIGFDAVRPDYLNYFNVSRPALPNFDKFLNSATVLTENYTPVARTLPSWAGILTGKYPLHNKIRENSVHANNQDITETLPKVLQQAGYETIYATDERRFNNINSRYGFNEIIGPDGTSSDYLLATLNDFPLSNLISTTFIGKLLFPYNYANRSAAYSYEPDNFLTTIQHALNKKSDKPLFLAIHFTLSGSPFYWFNDGQAYNVSGLEAYNNAVGASDQLLAKSLQLLQQQHLLDHAIVIVLSDHGITLGLPGDRAITEKKYLGNLADSKVRRTRYSSAKEINLTPEMQKQFSKSMTINLAEIANPTDYGIDTSLGYGGDVLSLKQHHALLAFKGYGVDIGTPHAISGRSMLLDIAPTLLDILKLPKLSASDGRSLRSYFYQSTKISNNRPIFLESAYSIFEIEQINVINANVAAKGAYLYTMDLYDGSLYLNPSYMQTLINNKQRAILYQNWLLAFYPDSERFKLSFKESNGQNQVVITPHILPAYFVLLDLATGQWTTNPNSSLVAKAKKELLFAKLKQFYGDEMTVYSKK